MTTKRTPALTKEARLLFEEEVRLYNGWQPGVTIARIAEATGLPADKVRDAIFGPSADNWRRATFPANAEV